MDTIAVRPDAELAVKDWLLALCDPTTGVIPDVGKNVFFGAPRSNAYPRLQVQLVAGTDDDYVDVLGEDEIQIDIVATNKQQAYAIGRHVVACIKALVDGTPMGSHAIGKGGRVVLGLLFRAEDERLAPDKKSGVARYVLGARFSLIPSA